MQTNLLPFNIDLLILTPDSVRGIQPIEVLDIFSGSTRNFHPQGLFSSEIFGKSGDERRSRRYSYIDLRIKVFHPVIFKALCDLKHLYGEILSGSSYAIWDEEKKDFFKCSPADGSTGYSYFLSHFSELTFEERDSDKRSFNIMLLNKYRDNCLMDKLIVMPAGLRDYEIDESGKPTENEINGFYRRAFSFANLISPTALKLNPDSIDNSRYNIQLEINKIYDYIKNMLEGKKKLILGKWAARRIYNGTRNVITTMNSNTDELNGDIAVGVNQTLIGLYQYLKAVLPISIYKLKNGFLSNVFLGPNSPVALVNKKTLKKELVNVDSKYYDEWMTDEGLEKVITRFGEEDLRHMNLEIQNYYMGLIYKGPDKTYKLLQDISELPSDLDPKNVHPLTFTELLYLSVYKDANTMPCFVTRYPVISYGGIYPSYVYLKTTVRADVRTELNNNWEVTPDCPVAIQFPILNEQFMNSLSPHNSKLGRLGADFDGDTCSANIVYTDEAKAEVGKLLNSRKFYVGTDGKMNFSSEVDTISLVLANMTG